MAHLSIRLLGSFQVTLDGQPVTAFESDKVRALLAYLAVEAERPHRRERLAGLLWPDTTERSARVNLRHVLANLRQAIGDREATPPFLHISRRSIQFNRESDAWVDAKAFSDLVESGVPDPQTLPRFEEVVSLYRGSFLEGFSLADSAAFEEWVLLETERLRRLATEATLQLVDCHEERGEYDVALGYARSLVELDPLLEAGHQRVMRNLAIRGQRSGAVAQYEACRQVLEQELGVEPAPETTALYQRILAGEIAAPAEATGPPPQNLPPQVTPFVGREAVLSEIGERLEDPVCRLLTLVGPGGSGKTRLALEAAERQLEHYPQGVFFVSLAPLNSAESIVPTVAEAVGFTFYPGGEPQQQLLNYLRAKRMLLLLDNYEHLLEGAGVVSEVLKTAPEVKVLVTSRARLNVGGEHRYQVTGMDYPDAEQMGNLREDAVQSIRSAQEALHYSAVKLFLQGARRALPGFELTEENLSDVVQICHLVEGMPLAIRLAASWVDTLTVAQIASEITQSLDLLETELLDVPERQRSVRATINHSSLAKICGNSKTAMS